MTFRMPLYFILSGLFFKTYNGLLDFSIRKINKLMIPYCFWYILSGIVIPVIIWNALGYKLWFYDGFGLEAVKRIFGEEDNGNPHLWFLSCLFLVNILFYILLQFSKGNLRKLFLFTLIVGLTGLLLSCFNIDLPYFVDSAFSSTPFFTFGWFLRNKTNFFYLQNSRERNIKVLKWIVVYIIVLCFINVGRCEIFYNQYGGWIGCLLLYPLGIIGTLGILSISRMAGSISIVSYLGRYSIIVLCTHGYLIQLSHAIVTCIVEERHVVLWCTFLTTTLLSLIAVPLCKKCLPWFTAQKDLICMKI